MISQLGVFNKYLKIAAQLSQDKLIQNLEALNTIKGWLLPNQFVLLYTIGLCSEGKIVEIGSFRGKSACLWALTTDKENTKIYCIDPFVWDEDHFLEDFKVNLMKFGFLDRINIQKGPSLIRVNDHENESADLIYIDGAHDYENVKEDINQWYHKLKPGGLMIGHDYPNPDDPNGGFEGLSNAVNQFVRDDKRFKNFGYYCGIWGAIKI